MLRPFGTGIQVAAAFVAVALAATACKKDEPKPLEPQAEPSAAAAEAPAAAARSEYHEAPFDVVIRPVPPYVVGKPGVVEIQLDAKGEYHMNDTYPYRFKTHASDSVQFGAPTYSKDAMKLEAARGTMKLEVTPQSPGEKSVSGLFLFSVCSAERCLVEKRELQTTLPVAAAN